MFSSLSLRESFATRSHTLSTPSGRLSRPWMWSMPWSGKAAPCTVSVVRFNDFMFLCFSAVGGSVSGVMILMGFVSWFAVTVTYGHSGVSTLITWFIYFRFVVCAVGRCLSLLFVCVCLCSSVFFVYSVMSCRRYYITSNLYAIKMLYI